MSEEKDGGPAFPCENWTPGHPGVRHGMSLRDYFAARALPAIIAVMCQYKMTDWREQAVASAYLTAEMMLEARKK